MVRLGLAKQSDYDKIIASLMQSGVWSGAVVNRHFEDKHYMVILYTVFKWEVEGQSVYVSLHQPIDLMSVEGTTAIGSLNTVEGIFLKTIAKIAEWNDPEQERHVWRVSALSRWIAEMASTVGLIADEDVDVIEAASVVHDIGKAAVPKEILFKPGGLSEGERTHVKDHTVIGGEMIDVLYSQMNSIHNLYRKLFEFAKDSALTHHEWWNGHGYPKGLAGEEIPVVGRVVALADVIDALLSKRPYKASWPPDKVKEYIMQSSGKQFDPLFVHLVIAEWDARPVEE